MKPDDLPRFMQCNGSRQMPAVLPPAERTAAAEGEAVHWLATVCFNGEFSEPYELVDRRSPDGVFITIDMADAAEAYLAAIRNRNAVYDWSAMEYTTRFAGMIGRADFIGFSGDTLFIDDLKFGWGIIEPDYNWTMIFHAVAFLQEHEDNFPLCDKIVLTIHQPRPWHHAGNIREWAIGRDVLLQLRSSLERALASPLDTLQTGPECNHCPALATCPAARQAALNAIDVSDVILPDDIDPANLELLYASMGRAEKMLKQKKEAVEKLITHKINTGEQFENYHPEQTTGHRRWNDGVTPETIKAFSGVDITKSGLITPKEAERRGVPEFIVNLFTHRPRGDIKLVRESINERAKRKLK